MPVLPVHDTLKRVTDEAVTATVDRAGLYAAQTPQGFSFELIRRLHEEYRDTPVTSTTPGLWPVFTPAPDNGPGQTWWRQVCGTPGAGRSERSRSPGVRPGGPDARPAHTGDQNARGLYPVHEIVDADSAARDIENHDVGDHLLGVDNDPGHVRYRFGQAASALMVEVQNLRSFFQGH